MPILARRLGHWAVIPYTFFVLSGAYGLYEVQQQAEAVSALTVAICHGSNAARKDRNDSNRAFRTFLRTQFALERQAIPLQRTESPKLRRLQLESGLALHRLYRSLVISPLTDCTIPPTKGQK